MMLGRPDQNASCTPVLMPAPCSGPGSPAKFNRSEIGLRLDDVRSLSEAAPVTPVDDVDVAVQIHGGTSANNRPLSLEEIGTGPLTGSTVWCSLSLVSASNQLTLWQRWVRQPQNIWLRRALFQVHLWSGIAIGLYVLMIAVTGSVLVYSNELYRAATPPPIISKGSGPRLTDGQLKSIALHLYPAYVIANLQRAHNPDEAVNVRLRRGESTINRLFDPRTGADRGDAVPTGIR